MNPLQGKKDGINSQIDPLTEFIVNEVEDNEQFEDLSMRLPVKQHIERLEDLLRGLLIQLEDSKKEIQVVRGEFQSLNFLNNQVNNELAKDIANETIRISKVFLDLAGINNQEHSEMNSTVADLKEKKTLLEEKTVLLESRVEETEGSVGYKQYIENLSSTYPLE